MMKMEAENRRKEVDGLTMKIAVGNSARLKAKTETSVAAHTQTHLILQLDNNSMK